MMESIADELLHTTVRLEGIKKNGSSVGTGFFFYSESRIFLVTNKHVVEGVTSGEFFVLKAGYENDQKVPILGSFHRIGFTESQFIGHPESEVDVAVMNVSEYLDGTAYWKHVTEEIFPTESDFKNFIGPMEDIVFVGYPNGIFDTKNLLPVARKGMTATPCYLDFEGHKKFLIDASVFPGSSGSPVFIYYRGGHSDKQGTFISGNRYHFIGIIAKVFQRIEQGEIKVVEIPTEQTKVAEINQMIDLGIAFNPETIVETVKHFVSRTTEKTLQDRRTLRNDPCHCGSGRRFKHCHGK